MILSRDTGQPRGRAELCCFNAWFQPNVALIVDRVLLTKEHY